MGKGRQVQRRGEGRGEAGVGADYCQLLQFKAATINKDVSSQTDWPLQ